MSVVWDVLGYNDSIRLELFRRPEYNWECPERGVRLGGGKREFKDIRAATASQERSDHFLGVSYAF